MYFVGESVSVCGGNVRSGHLSDKNDGTDITDAKSLLGLNAESDVRFLPAHIH